MMWFPLFLAAALSAGNVEFERTAARGAFDIAVGREAARLVSEGPAKGTLARAMLADPVSFAKADAAKDAAWSVYRALLDAEYARIRQAAGERLGISDLGEAKPDDGDWVKAKASFDARYAAERAAACAEQAASLVGSVRPTVADFETKDEGTLRRELSTKVAAQQKTAVFEENLGYISAKIVEPVIEAAKRERKRQGEYLRRVKSDAHAPSALTKDLSDKLVLNVKSRQSKSDDLAYGWDVFPSVTNVTLRHVVHRRTMERLAVQVAELPYEVTTNEVSKTMSGNRAQHRKADESREIFRRTWTLELSLRSVAALRDEAPERERSELGEYLTKNASDEAVAKAVHRRIDGQLLPKLAEVRCALTDAEFAKTWPTLVDRTWYPDAETADATSARSDFASAVRAWRDLPGLVLERGEETLEESAARADKAVAAAFELARGAVMAQTRIVDEMHPSVLAQAREKKDSFWSATPDFGKVVAMLTAAVEQRWDESKVGVLWPRGDAPANAEAQHAELFPSVKKRIEMVAKTIVAEMNEPKPTDSQGDSEELSYSIVVTREGDRVTVKLDQGGATLVERNAKAKMGDFRGAIQEVGEKLGKDILKLQ